MYGVVGGTHRGVVVAVTSFVLFTGMKYFQHKEIALNISGRITFARSSTCLDTEKVYLLMIAAIIEGKFHFLHKAKTAAQMSEQNHNILLHGPGQD